MKTRSKSLRGRARNPGDPPPRVGQIGLGIMGGAFAKHLCAAGFDVAGFDVDPARRAALRELGGQPGRSIGAVSRGRNVLVTSLPSLSAVDAVFFGEGGILAEAASGTIVIETSTLPLEVKLRLKERCAPARITVLDCPISGTGAQAAAKDISVYASGARDAVDSCSAIFAAFARSVHYCGEYGNGSKLKFIANLLVTIHNLSAAEAIVLGRRSGLDLDLVYKVIRDGAGTSRMFEVRAPLMIEGDYSRATMKIDVYQKDIDIISAYASGLHCPTPLFEASKAFYSGAYAQGYASEDTAAICAVLENMAGIPREADRKPRKTRKVSKT